MDLNKDEKLPASLSEEHQKKPEKNIIKTVFLTIMKLVLTGIIALLTLCFVVLVLYFFDESGSCMDLDGVWDDEQKICRYDCLAWSKKTGCVPLDKPEVWPQYRDEPWYSYHTTEK